MYCNVGVIPSKAAISLRRVAHVPPEITAEKGFVIDGAASLLMGINNSKIKQILSVRGTTDKSLSQLYIQHIGQTVTFLGHVPMLPGRF